MDTILTIISAVLAIGALILCISTWRALRPASETNPPTGGELSPLERRKKALELATKAWLYSVEHGLTYSGSRQKEVVDRLEREVAALENEQFSPKEEEPVTPKAEAPKRKHVTNVSGKYHEVWGRIYRVRCSDCVWSWDSYSAKTAEAEGTAHERRNA